MTRVRALIANECRLLLRSGMLVAIVLMLAVISSLALWSGHLQVARHKRAAGMVSARDRLFVDSLTRSALEYERRVSTGDTTQLVVRNGVAVIRRRTGPGAWVLAFEGRPAVLQSYPLAPLALGVSGISAAYPIVSFRTAAHALRDDAEIQNPMVVALGRLDLAFVVVYILPLLVIALTYNVVSGDRETGALDIVASLPISLPLTIIVRALTRTLFVVFTMCAAIVLGGFVTANGPFASVMPMLLTWCAIATAHALFWTSLSLLSNTLIRTSAANALALAAAWMFFTFVVPSIAATAGRTFNPLPSRATELARVREFTAKENGHAAALLERLYQARPNLRNSADSAKPVNINYLNFAVARRVDTLLLPEKLVADANWRRQERMVGITALIAPPLLTARALMTMSGTDAERERRYTNALSQFQSTYYDFYLPRFFLLKEISAAEIRTSPRFAMDEPSPFTQWPVLMCLILLPVGTAAIAGVAAYRLRTSTVMAR